MESLEGTCAAAPGSLETGYISVWDLTRHPAVAGLSPKFPDGKAAAQARRVGLLWSRVHLSLLSSSAAGLAPRLLACDPKTLDHDKWLSLQCSETAAQSSDSP